MSSIDLCVVSDVFCQKLVTQIKFVLDFPKYTLSNFAAERN